MRMGYSRWLQYNGNPLTAMPLLLPSEYNSDYFNGVHPAGYSPRYERWPRLDPGFCLDGVSTGEFYNDSAKNINILGFLSGKKFMEIGCGYGYIIKWLRDNGIEAYGIDVSAYAISQADPSIAPYLQVGDIRTVITGWKKNAYNVLYSRNMLCCFSDADLASLITEMNRVGFLQIHQIWDDNNPEYYNPHTLAWYLVAGFKKGTNFILNNDFNNPYEVT